MQASATKVIKCGCVVRSKNRAGAKFLIVFPIALLVLCLFGFTLGCKVSGGQTDQLDLCLLLSDFLLVDCGVILRNCYDGCVERIKNPP